MLTGKQLGEAIKTALALKGRGAQKALADALGMKPPSINDMKNFGRIDKKHLPALWKFFSDVVGPEHWGIQQYPWHEDLKNKAKPIPENIRLSAEWWPEVQKKDLTGPAYWGVATQPKREFPRVVGTARMGDQGYYLDLEGGNGHVEFEAEPGSIAIQVRGESMHPAIRDGWYVVIEPEGRPSPGEYVLLIFMDGRKMVKELLMERPDSYVVMSVNSGERITAMKNELEGIQAITAVVPPSKHKP